MARSAVAVVALLLFGAPARAQLDPETKGPCLWRVVLAVKPHPQLTPEVRDRLKRDIVATLQPGLGNLGAVEVIDLGDAANHPRDRWEALWVQFDDKGFAALDTPRDLSGAKTHFLKVEHRDGLIHLESRQYDGFTGLSSPLVRTQSTRAPELIGRTAGLMLDRDFGLAGTVAPVAGRTDEVRVLVRGSGLAPVKDFVQVGDVFAVAAVRKTNRPAPAPVRTATGKIVEPPPGSVPPPGLTSTPRDFTLLKVVEVAPDGCRCHVLTRYADAMPQKNAVGYRAMKLGTIKAPVAVRLMGGDGAVYKTASNVTVRATDTDFFAAAGAPPAAVFAFDNPSAQFRSPRPLANVACITVSTGPTQAKQFPVPVMSADPITLPFDNNPEREKRAEFERAVLAAAGWAADARVAQSVCFETVAKLIEKQKNAEALTHAENGFKAADSAVTKLGEELARLDELAKEVPKADGVDAILAKVRQNLDALKAYNAQLGEHVKKIGDVVAREKDPNVGAKEVQAQGINNRIAILLARGDVDEALAAYDQLFALVPNDADVKTRKDALAAEWKVKDDAHQKARDYLLRTWPAVATIPDFRDSLPQVRAAVEVCKKHGDKWTLRKLLTVFAAAAPKLNELAAPLDAASDADRKLLKDANDVGKAMAALELELRKLVDG